ncbi:transposase [Streptomyces sp. NPDC085929]|uniref:transposase n=1 Tax=Streptomyces sp. NPDC085929 TaxID=3365739 RepID=UPI0037D6255A
MHQRHQQPIDENELVLRPGPGFTLAGTATPVMAPGLLAWRYLPHDFPPHTTVYGYFKEWERDGTTEEIHDTLRDQLRAKKGRRILPTAAIVDAQSVKASPNAPEESQGFDGGKKVKGRKRHIATDTLGLLLVLIVTAAGVQDSAGGK